MSYLILEHECTPASDRLWRAMHISVHWWADYPKSDSRWNGAIQDTRMRGIERVNYRQQRAYGAIWRWLLYVTIVPPAAIGYNTVGSPNSGVSSSHVHHVRVQIWLSWRSHVIRSVRQMFNAMAECVSPSCCFSLPVFLHARCSCSSLWSRSECTCQFCDAT